MKLKGISNSGMKRLAQALVHEGYSVRMTDKWVEVGAA